jgi:hypothetical protein
MRRASFASNFASCLTLCFAAPALADTRVTDQPYIRQDGSTDTVIATCSNDSPGVSAGGNRQQNEPSVAMKPDEPSFIVVAANDYCVIPSFRDAWQGVYVSQDRGTSFINSLLPGYPGDTSTAGETSPLFGVDTAASDPVMDWDDDGHLFLGGVAFNRTVTIGSGGKTQTNGVMYVSTWLRDTTSALGIAYQRTVVAGPGTPSVDFRGRVSDKPSLKVDAWATSPHRGSVYAAWTLFPGAGQDEILFSRSVDHGVTFSRPTILSKRVPNAQGSTIAVASDGTVYVAWRQFASRAAGVTDAIVFVKSIDGGAHFSDPATLRGIIGYDRKDVSVSGVPARDCGSGPALCLSGFTFHRSDTLPQATADRHGNVYVSWEEVTPLADNGDTYRPDGQSQVVVTRSNDGGATWIDPAKVDPQSVGHQWWPKLAYDKATDTVLIAYYDSRDDPSYSPFRPPGNTADGLSACGVPGSFACDVLNTFVAASADQGATWVAVRASSAGHQPEYEMFGGRTVPFHGDYIGLDAAAGTLFSAWTDNRDVMPGTDPREAPDGFDVLQCRATPSSSDTCPDAGGLNQNIFGAASSLE